MTESAASFSMEDFEKALGQFDYEFSNGQIVTGKAVAYESDTALIDIGGKSPVFCPGMKLQSMRPMIYLPWCQLVKNASS